MTRLSVCFLSLLYSFFSLPWCTKRARAAIVFPFSVVLCISHAQTALSQVFHDPTIFLFLPMAYIFKRVRDPIFCCFFFCQLQLPAFFAAFAFFLLSSFPFLFSFCLFFLLALFSFPLLFALSSSFSRFVPALIVCAFSL